ncbi:MAG TPA: hypothetical protein VMU22_07980 [Rhizomicrobium sp.]|nr:hypothetical protein [Rhizomicrobium sp.]
MIDNLGLGDALDGVELLRDVEKVFDVQIANKEAEALWNVGDLYDLILKKLPRGEANTKCASAMAFYRLRRAFIDLSMTDVLSPSSDMAAWRSVHARPLFRELESRTGLNMPRQSFSWIGKTGGWIALSWLAAMTFDLLLPPIYKPILQVLSIYCWSALPLAFAFAQFDPGRFPRDCRTFGDLVTKVSYESYGKLVKAGAATSEQAIWTALTEAVESVTNVPAAKIARETLFLQASRRR